MTGLPWPWPVLAELTAGESTAGELATTTCSRCKDVPYVDGTQPDHWCTACTGQPVVQMRNCHPIHVACPGPPSPRTEENAHLAGELQTLELQLADLASDVSMDLEEPSALVGLTDRLDELAIVLRTRAAGDPLSELLLREHDENRSCPVAAS